MDLLNTVLGFCGRRRFYFTFLCEMGIFLLAAGEPTLLFANRHDLRQLHIYSGRYRLIVDGMHSATAIDYDYHSNTVFWTDNTSTNISRYAQF